MTMAPDGTERMFPKKKKEKKHCKWVWDFWKQTFFTDCHNIFPWTLKKWKYCPWCGRKLKEKV